MDSSCSKPVIEQIHDHLADQIVSGAIAVGDQLPSRSALARQFGVSLGTVGIAVQRLGESMPLRSVPGAGVYLCERSPKEETFTIALIGTNASMIARDRGALHASESYLAPVIQRIMLCCHERKLALLTIPGTSAEPLDVYRIASFGADCLISHGVPHRKETILELRRRGIPLVMGNRGDGSLPLLGASYVDYDSRGVFRDAVRVFHEHGHRRIATVYCQSSDEAWTTWRDAFCLEAVARGISLSPGDHCRMVTPELWQGGTATVREAVRRHTEALLDLPQPPTAIFVHEEARYLDSALEALATRGLKVGRDVGMLCLGQSNADRDYPLSCFAEPADLLGELLVDTAQKLAANPHEVFQVDVPLEFVDRGSVSRMGA